MSTTLKDEFRGDDAHLVRSIEALLALDAHGALVPHGVGGLARNLLSAAAVRLGRAAPVESTPVGDVRVGNLVTLNQDGYPGLGQWWVQLRVGPEYDEVLARVYGGTPEETRQRADKLVAALNQRSGGECTRSGGCVCGGDTEGVRRGCGYWQEVQS